MYYMLGKRQPLVDSELCKADGVSAMPCSDGNDDELMRVSDDGDGGCLMARFEYAEPDAEAMKIADVIQFDSDEIMKTVQTILKALKRTEVHKGMTKMYTYTTFRRAIYHSQYRWRCKLDKLDRFAGYTNDSIICIMVRVACGDYRHCTLPKIFNFVLVSKLNIVVQIDILRYYFCASVKALKSMSIYNACKEVAWMTNQTLVKFILDLSFRLITNNQEISLCIGMICIIMIECCKTLKTKSKFVKAHKTLLELAEQQYQSIELDHRYTRIDSKMSEGIHSPEDMQLQSKASITMLDSYMYKLFRWQLRIYEECTNDLIAQIPKLILKKHYVSDSIFEISNTISINELIEVTNRGNLDIFSILISSHITDALRSDLISNENGINDIIEMRLDLFEAFYNIIVPTKSDKKADNVSSYMKNIPIDIEEQLYSISKLWRYYNKAMISTIQTHMNYYLCLSRTLASYSYSSITTLKYDELVDLQNLFQFVNRQTHRHRAMIETSIRLDSSYWASAELEIVNDIDHLPLADYRLMAGDSILETNRNNNLLFMPYRRSPDTLTLIRYDEDQLDDRRYLDVAGRPTHYHQANGKLYCIDESGRIIRVKTGMHVGMNRTYDYTGMQIDNFDKLDFGNSMLMSSGHAVVMTESSSLGHMFSKCFSRVNIKTRKQLVSSIMADNDTGR